MFSKTKKETCRIDWYTSAVSRTLPRTRIPADRWPANGRPPPPAAPLPVRRLPALRKLPAPPVLPAPPARQSPAVSPANRRSSRRPTMPTVYLGPQVFFVIVAKIHINI